MNLKNRFKRFWTLDVHNHEGFTLVELIIVIAILAILSTGAIAGYSAYVEKANKTADEAMIAEIKNVLMMHYYSSTTPQAGYVIIGQNTEDNDANSFADEAMKDAYGDNWKSTLVLKYGGWENKLMDAINKQNNIGGFAGAVVNSSYMSSSTADLLGEVSDITSTALDFLDGYGSNTTGLYNTLCNLYYPNDPDKFNELCEKYDISTKQGKNGWEFDGASSAELSNFLVLATAYDMSNQLDDLENYETSAATQLVLSFAGFNAYTKYKDDPEVTKAYNEMLTAMGNATTPGEMKAAIATFGNQFEGDFNGDFMESGQHATDMSAFLGIMDALDAVSDGMDLSDPSLFAPNGQIANQFDTYVSVSSMLEEIGTLPEGAIVVIIDENGNVK